MSELAELKTIEVTFKDGHKRVVERVDRVDMKDALLAWRGDTLIYGAATGVWDSWCVIPEEGE